MISDTHKASENYTSGIVEILNVLKADSVIYSNYSPGSNLFAANDSIVLDNGTSLIPYQLDLRNNFYLSGFGGVLRGNNIKGYLTGLNLGFNKDFGDNLVQMQFSYTYANSEQNLATQSATTRARLYSLGVLDKLNFNSLESELKANILLGNFEFRELIPPQYFRLPMQILTHISLILEQI